LTSALKNLELANPYPWTTAPEPEEPNDLYQRPRGGKGYRSVGKKAFWVGREYDRPGGKVSIPLK